MADDNKYLTQFIIEAGKVAFTTADGQKWQMRQPTPAESAAGDSAYRLARESVLTDPRLKALAQGPEALEREANIRSAAAQAAYMLPLLLETTDGRPAFNVFEAEAMAKFEALPPEIIIEMTHVFWGPVQQAIIEAKKKQPAF